VLLISTYELGRQPFGLASPAAWLRDAGLDVTCCDASRQRIEDAAIRAADALGFYLPMHTATRLALPLIERVRRVNPAARQCAFGLYAPLNQELLRACGVEAVFGGEFEAALVEWLSARSGHADASSGIKTDGRRTAPLPRLEFRVPDRTGLPALNHYASLQLPDGSRRVTGYTEASRGCKHWCRHCPIVPVYEGRFRIVPPEIVIADARAQIDAGARHITFGDPDFFNGIGHALAVVHAFATEFPGVTYDVTIKIEHLLKHADALAVLTRTGCVLVTSAVESVDDAVLARLDKGHTRAEFEHAVALCRAAGLSLAPTFVPFTPWTTIQGYNDLLDAILALDLVEQVAPIQLAIRLLIPNASRLLELPEVRDLTGPFDPRLLVYPWRHADPRVDRLQAEIESLVGSKLNAPRAEAFASVRSLARAAAGLPPRASHPRASRTTIPYLTEPWYC
jgi:radical SAM superfamily enzyme YgiQ (UPF0313 family)